MSTKRREFLSGPPRMGLLEARSRIQNAVVLAGITMFASAPMFYHEFERMGPRLFTRPVTDHRLLALAVGQSLILFGLAILCALVGFLYAHRLALPALGDADLKPKLPLAFLIGAAIIPLSYFAFERGQLAEHPELFPSPWYWAAATAAGSSLAQEVIARFGLITICVYLLRWRGVSGHPWLATVTVSLFLVFGQYVRLSHLKLAGEFEPANLVLILGASFLFQTVLCETYLRKGLLAAIALHLGFGMRFVVYSFY